MKSSSLFLFVVYFIFAFHTTTRADSYLYDEFNNITLSPEAAVVNCIIRDSQGIIWFGSDRGLYSYDGYRTKPHRYVPQNSKIIPDTKINCSVLLDKERICFGSGNGLLIFNTVKDEYENIEGKFPTDILSLSLVGKKLWIGSITGLYCYDLSSKRLKNIKQSSMGENIPFSATYSLLNSMNKVLYIGTYNGLYYKNEHEDVFHKINLPVLQTKNSLLINSLLEDTKHHCIWIGTEGNLFCYYLNSKKIECIGTFKGNSIKSLATDEENNLLVGTDNGLYVYNKNSNLSKQIVHDLRYGTSLSNNIIWTIFVDNEHNAWFGTDYGVSQIKYDKLYRFIPISQITNIGDGNQLQCIYKDTRGNIWYGGTNGLIRYFEDGSHIWYRMGDIRYPISHNRIRDIYEDKEGNLWVATDGSVNRYDYSTKRFIRYDIVDKTLTRNANWSYQIAEDQRKMLWIATCIGGVFVVDKQKLMNAKEHNYVAEMNYFQHTGKNGLSDNYIIKIVTDKYDNVWALTNNNKLDKINAVTNEVKEINFIANDKDKSSNGNAFCLYCDNEGHIWVGYDGGLTRINPLNDAVEYIKTELFNNCRIRDVNELGNELWICSSDGVFVLNKRNMLVRHVRMIDKDFSCSYYDEQSKKMYLGTVDGFVVFSPENISKNKLVSKLILTGFYVNDYIMQAGKDYEGNSIRSLEEITLKHNQNNISIDFSDLSYSRSENKLYVYRLDGSDKIWRNVKNNSNHLSYTNLPFGRYTLHIGTLSEDGTEPVSLLNFKIKIKPPWFYGFWAKLSYALMICGIIFWIIKYFRNRNLARIRNIEREKSLELSKMKIDFFTHVSHDFKTPLSLILGPVSKLLLEIKNPTIKKQLQLVQQNALNLNSLIQQVIGFERLDNNSASSNLIVSHVEFVEFCKSIFSSYDDGFKAKNIRAVFSSEIEKLNVDIDVLKMESVLNNVISNALKYTNEGNVLLKLALTDDNTFKITLTDTGIGIPNDDLPHIFDRFHQSEKTKNKRDGSGIGLYLVKQYVELHQGKVEICSDENVGTTVTIFLPVKKQLEIHEDYLPEISEGKDAMLPKVLIVEDNIEVSEFLKQILRIDFQCIITHNGKAGFDAALVHHPDIIITDVMMPVMDGLEMCKKLRKQKETAFTPIIMLTAKDDKLTEEKSIELDVNAFVSKPFDTGLLLSRIRQLLNINTKIREKIKLEVITEPKTVEIISIDEKFLKGITAVIEDKIADTDLNVNKLSEILGISTKQIYRRVKQLTGMSPVDYIRTIRMKKAAVLLSQHKFSVAEVMYLVGFSNSSYFSKCFHAMFGKTPRQYMDEI